MVLLFVLQKKLQELNLNDYFAENNMTYKPIYVEGNKEQTKLFGGECDVFTTDASGLASTESGAEDPSKWGQCYQKSYQKSH